MLYLLANPCERAVKNDTVVLIALSHVSVCATANTAGSRSEGTNTIPPPNTHKPIIGLEEHAGVRVITHTDQLF